ncbi:glucose-6-phosphate isomerase [Panacagrimonas sp.]|uniref:glucose-6-phosphate isomerase n=1 Tax=Panacagrimonas sp. TaxID=2480088 RepID=UPI003B5217EC
MTPLESTPAWSTVDRHAQRLRATLLRDLFEDDPARAARYSAQACGLTLDYSKQRIDDAARAALLDLTAARQLSDWRRQLFDGAAINHTERRAALHMALRAPRDRPLHALGVDVGDDVHAVLDRMCDFAERLRSGCWRGATDEPIRDVVNIGIGGSDLGPRMVVQALRSRDAGADPRAHFVANVDGAQLADVLAQLQPARTLFVVTSKTFTTQETMANAGNARRWLVDALGTDAVGRHFVAVSTNSEAVAAFGIAPDNCFAFWDWVGGRYSVWSAVGLSAMLALGPECFRQLLAGAHAMDRHFVEADDVNNLPLLLALLAVWNMQALGAASHVVSPYAQRLEYFVAWLQQLEMESNGKCVMRDGTPVPSTTPALWGDVGTNSQHAFFQMLHQGPALHAVDFIVALRGGHAYPDQHRLLLANVLAQAAALMRGKSADEVRAELAGRGLAGAELEAAIPHRVFPGNRPSNLLLLPQLDAWHLGALMALYEHRTFVLSVLWGINPFDQWGVELGKQLAQRLLQPGAGEDASLDASTRAHLGALNDPG